nr:peptidylprolyl isomerase [Sansalvadorimonas verongulae]
MSNPVVVMDTSMGKIEITLDQEKAPVTVKNFLEYTHSGFYNNTIFHRVIDGFMVQGGGFTSDMSQKATKAPIKNESANGLTNDRGTIAMARTSAPDSASSQFFINLVNNSFLNGSHSKAGYAVFGKVTTGMDVVDKIAGVKTGHRGMYADVPEEAVVIKSVTVKKGEDTKTK